MEEVEGGLPISSMGKLNQDIQINSEPQSEPTEEVKMSTDNDAVFDRFKGTIIGALWGDAIGAVLEFYFKEITDKIALKAFTMPGGGAHKVGPGQITDDGELSMCLLHALSEGDWWIDRTQIARFYGQWIKSKPFDIGNTCRASLFKANPASPNPDLIIKQANKSIKSQSNGSLMRISPLAAFWYKLSKAEIMEAAALDASFTHSNDIVLHIWGLYCYAISMIIKGDLISDVFTEIKAAISELNNSDISEWLTESESELPPKVNTKAGWLKHAFIFCLRYLRIAIDQTELDKTFYTKWICEVLKGGGDTDTNACIVGGMIGAVVGFENLPETPKTAVLSWTSKKGGIKRDKFLMPSAYAEKLITKIYELAPDKLEIIN